MKKRKLPNKKSLLNALHWRVFKLEKKVETLEKIQRTPNDKMVRNTETK